MLVCHWLPLHAYLYLKLRPLDHADGMRPDPAQRKRSRYIQTNLKTVPAISQATGGRILKFRRSRKLEPGLECRLIIIQGKTSDRFPGFRPILAPDYPF